MRRIAIAGAVAIVLLLLVVAQLVLPGLAAQQLRDRLSRSGQVLEVKVDAFPAVELLWHHADRVVVRLARYQSSSGHLGSQLAQVADVGSLDASVRELDAGLLTLRNATLVKRGNELSGSAQVSEADLLAAVPFLDAVQPVASGGGQLTLRGTATLFGITASVNASVVVQDGRILIVPNVPFGTLATVTVFDNPHVLVSGVTASGTAGGFSVQAQGTVR